jgi:photosystem II stability/assembly factor-like uncharacterized protein
MKLSAVPVVVAVVVIVAANACGPGPPQPTVETFTAWQTFSGGKVPADAPIYVTGIDSVGRQTVWLTESWVTHGHSHTGVFRTDDGGAAWRQMLGWDGWPAFQRYFDSADALVVAEFENGYQLHARLLRTRDGGRHWSAADLPVRLTTGWGIHAIDFVDPSDGWLLLGLGGSGSANCGGTKEGVAIYRTQDGGASWSEVARVDDQHPNQQGLSISGGKVGLSFRTATSGYLTTFDPIKGNSVFLTNDGGNTWQMQALPVMQDRDLVVIAPPQWVTPDVGLMGVNIGPLSLVACVVRPSAAQSSAPPRSPQPWDVEPPFSLGQADSLSVLLATTDAGRHWAAVGPDTGLGYMSGYAAAGKDDWWLTGGSEIGATTDGGRSWRINSVLRPECDFGLVHFMDGKTGYASAFCSKPGPMEGCAHEGTDYVSEWDCPPFGLPLLVSQDGGVTWIEVAKPVLS